MYIVRIEYKIKGDKKATVDYKYCDTLEDAKAMQALAIKVFKPESELFDVAIYERTNY